MTELIRSSLPVSRNPTSERRCAQAVASGWQRKSKNFSQPLMPPNQAGIFQSRSSTTTKLSTRIIRLESIYPTYFATIQY